MATAYQEVVEIEDLNGLLNNYGSEFVITLLCYLTNRLNSNLELSSLYRFEVISYGFLGYYPAIGVVYLTDKSIVVEQTVQQFFKETGLLSIQSLIHFAKENQDLIKSLIDEIKKDNEARH